MSARLSDRFAELAAARTTAQLAREVHSAEVLEFDPGYRIGMLAHGFMSSADAIAKLSDDDLRDILPDVRLTLAVLCRRAQEVVS